MVHKSVARQSGETGYTLLEVMVAMCIAGILAAMAGFQIGAARPGIQADGAMRLVMSQLNIARETAIAQRRFIEIEFDTTARSMRLTRHELPNGETDLGTFPFEAGVHFTILDGVGDTPDTFGKDGAIDFGSANSIMFDGDGMLIDETGSPVNGTVFLGVPSMPTSQRAVTIMGTTGRVRGYKWYGNGGWARG